MFSRPAGFFINYLGVDQSAALIKIARENYPENNFKVLAWQDLAQLPENNFAYIFSLAVLHHIPSRADRIRALELAKTKLAPQGKIIISVWNLWARPKFLKLIIKFWWSRLLGKNDLELGDILFPWGGKTRKKDRAVAEEGAGENVETDAGQDSGKESTANLRYYHDFTFWELKKISRVAGLKIKRIYKDKFNYYLILEKS
jgi:SAM-dependent methyltransferase